MNGVLDVRVAGGRVVHLDCAPPVSAKVLAGPTLLIVGSAAGLLEGDDIAMTVRLDPGEALTVRTPAATLAHRCQGDGETSVAIEVRLGHGARLAWLPEPLITHAGCRHRSMAQLDLALGAAAVWAESVALGRHGEPGGDVEMRVDADLDGRPLLRDGLRLGPSAHSAGGPAVLAGARYVSTLALLGRRAESDDAAVMALAGPGMVARALGADAAAVERRLSPLRTVFLDRLFRREAFSSVA